MLVPHLCMYVVHVVFLLEVDAVALPVQLGSLLPSVGVRLSVPGLICLHPTHAYVVVCTASDGVRL